MIRLYKITSPVWDEENPIPPQTALAATNGADYAYLVGEGGFTEWDALGTIVGSWSQDTGLQEGQEFNEQGDVIGTPTHPVTADYAWVRPFGNKDRLATQSPLDSLRFQGHVEPKFLQGDSRYTDTDDPFTLTISRDLSGVYPEWDSGTTYDTGEKVMWEGQGYQSQQTNNTDHEPGAPGSGPFWAVTEFGYGWIATMIEPAVSQDPITNYNIRVYPTAECVPGDQIYTSGNFADIGEVFETRAASNNWTPTEEDVHIALIFVGGGNSQNGIITLPVGTDSVTAQFWSHDQ